MGVVQHSIKRKGTVYDFHISINFAQKCEFVLKKSDIQDVTVNENNNLKRSNTEFN